MFSGDEDDGENGGGKEVEAMAEKEEEAEEEEEEEVDAVAVAIAEDADNEEDAINESSTIVTRTLSPSEIVSAILIVPDTSRILFSTGTFVSNLTVMIGWGKTKKDEENGMQDSGK